MKQYRRGKLGAHSGLRTTHDQYQTAARRSKSHFQRERYPRQPLRSGMQLQFLSDKKQITAGIPYSVWGSMLLTGNKKALEGTARIMVLANMAYEEQVTCWMFASKMQKAILPPKNPQARHNNLNRYSFNTQKCVMQRTAINDVLELTGKF